MYVIELKIIQSHKQLIPLKLLISRKYEFYTHSTLDGNPQAMTIHTAPAVVRTRPLKEG